MTKRPRNDTDLHGATTGFRGPPPKKATIGVDHDVVRKDQAAHPTLPNGGCIHPTPPPHTAGYPHGPSITQPHAAPHTFNQSGAVTGEFGLPINEILFPPPARQGMGYTAPVPAAYNAVPVPGPSCPANSICMPLPVPLPMPMQTPASQSPPVPHVNWDVMLDTLDKTALKHVLSVSVSHSDSIQRWIIHYYMQTLLAGETTKAQETYRMYEFTQYASKAWYALNRKHGRTANAWLDEALDALDEIRGYVDSIKAQTHRESSFAMKESALQALLKIAESICGLETPLGNRLKLIMRHDPFLEQAMSGILDGMDADEIDRVAQSEDVNGEFLDRLDGVRIDGREDNIMLGMKDVFSMMIVASIAREGEGEDVDQEDEDKDDE